MNIRITKSQLDEIKNHLSPLLKKALVGKPIKPVTKFQQGLIPMGEEVLDESPDKVLNNYDDLIAHWSNDDAIAFGFLNGRALIGYNNELFFESDKISQDKKAFVDHMNYKDVEKMLMHRGISKFYETLYGENGIGSGRSSFEYPGRLWIYKNIISFWNYPDKNKLPGLLKELSTEIEHIYGLKIDFSNYRIEIKNSEYQADLDTNDEDYEPDLEWEENQKIGNLIPVKDFISSQDASAEEMQNIHTLPSAEKRNTPQMKAARDSDEKRLADKFPGNVSQAEWNDARNKYRGESKTILITKDQLNEINKHLNEENNANNINDNFINWFGNSKVVDENGKPLVCYHGTKKGGFTEFKPKTGTNNKPKQQLDLGSHFSVDKEYSDGYAGDGKNSKVYECYLKIENPLYTNRMFYREDDEITFLKYLNFSVKVFKYVLRGDDFYDKNGNKQSEPQSIMINSFLIDKIPSNKLYNGLIEFGFDGVFHEPYNKEDLYSFKKHPVAYVVLYPNQIKSIDNNGEWGMNNNNNIYEMGEKTIKITTTQLNEINKYLNEESNCPNINISKEIYDHINKFNTDEEFLRAGGLPTNMLDKIAFGFDDSDIKTLNPKQLKIKWYDDLDNVIWEQQKSGLNKVEWAKKINLSEPIDVSYEKNKFYLEDGHHRYYAARILGKDLNVNLEIKMNPVLAIAPNLTYDSLCRCLFKQVKSDKMNESTTLNETTVYHASRNKIDKVLPYSDYKSNIKSGYYPGMYFFNGKDTSELFYDHNKYFIYKTDIDGLKLYNVEDGDELKKLASENGAYVNGGSGYPEARWLESIGYDGMSRGKEIIIFHPEKLNIEPVKTNIEEDVKSPNYLKWKRSNVTIRGIKEYGNENNVYGSFGKGLYTVPLSNLSMAKQYGVPYFVVNAIPKSPKILDGLNSAEMLRQKLVKLFCDKNNKDYSMTFFEENTSMEIEMIELGYDGLIIKGREMVNYTPKDIKYFKNEYELINYYDSITKNIKENSNITPNIKFIAYHGSSVLKSNGLGRTNDISNFDTKGHWAQRVSGAYFSPDIKEAKKYAKKSGDKVYKAELTFKNIANRDVLDKISPVKYNGEQARELLIKNGYDGVYDEPMKEIIAFYPDQIKILGIVDSNIEEDIKLPVKVGDTIMMGKFKNKKVVIKNIGEDDFGMPTINGKKAATFRIPKKIEEENKASYRNALRHMLTPPNTGMFTNETKIGEIKNAFKYATSRGAEHNEDVYIFKSKNGIRYLASEDNLESMDAAAFINNDNILTGIIVDFGLTNVGIGGNLLKIIKNDIPELKIDDLQSDEGKRIFKENLTEATIDDEWENEEPITKGTFTLFRGSYDGNQKASGGIYANGIHYTNDISTAKSFGEPGIYDVTLKNPIVLLPKEIDKYGATPKQVTNNLLSLGYDSLIVQHNKKVYSMYDEPDIEYKEYEIIMLSNNLTEATIDDVNLNSFKPKKELNDKFWIASGKGHTLKPIVRKRLLKIADDFIEYLTIDIKKVTDIIFLGSMANYNWSSYSDVDLHLVMDFSKINKDIELVAEYFDSKKKLWNDEHESLKIFGFPVELYVQDIKQVNASVGQFSLEKNKWLTKPEIIDDSDFDKVKIKEKASVIMTDIDDLLKAYKSKPNFSELKTISNKTKKLYDKIKKIRKQGLETEKGETSVGNIVFKVLRRNGYFEKLIDLKLVTYDKINSIK